MLAINIVYFILLTYTHLDIIICANSSIPSINLNRLGAIGFVGNFEGISSLNEPNPSSLQQNQSAILKYTKNSLSPIGILGNSSLITSFCSIQSSSNSSNTILFAGGKFSDIDNNQLSNLAKYSTSTNKWESVKWGVQGIVLHLLCHQKEQLVTIVGSFKNTLMPGFIYSPSTLSTLTPSIIQYNVTEDSWISLPFKGLNGPVTSIAKVPNSDAILVGGDFQRTIDGETLANGALANEIDLRLAKIYSDNMIRNVPNTPYSVICSKDPWLLQDNTKGSIRFEFPYPVKFAGIQLINSNSADRGTKQFSIMATPSNQFYNISYIDSQNNWSFCGANCPLQQNPGISQTYYFKNSSVPATTGIQINIQEWYGLSGGLGSVKLFVEESESLAQATVYTTNCPGLLGQAQSAIKGNWQTYSYPNTSQLYLGYQYKTDSSNWNTINQTISAIKPIIPEFGKYNLQLTFPPCSSQQECKARGQLQVIVTDNSESKLWGSTTVDLGSGKSSVTVYEGFLPSSVNNAGPQVFIRPIVPPKAQPELQVMVQSIKVRRVATKTDLNGLLSVYTTPRSDIFSNMQDIENSIFSDYPSGLPNGFRTTALAFVNNTKTIIAGDLNQNGIRSPKMFISQGSNTESIQFDNGNGVISHLGSSSNLNDTVFVGGAFKLRANNLTITNFGVYNVTSKKWMTVPRLQVISLSNMAQLGDDLYLAGKFVVGENTTTGLGTQLNYIRIDQVTLELSSDTLISGDVKSVGADQGSVYFNGQFTGAQTHRTPGLAILGPNGLASNTHSIGQPAASFLNWGQINTAAFYNMNSEQHYLNNQTLTIVAGGFETEKASKVAILDNGNWSSLFNKDEIKGNVSCIEISDNRMLIGGNIENKKGDRALLMYDLNKRQIMSSPPALTMKDSNDNSKLIVRDLLRLKGSSTIVAAGKFDNAAGTSCQNMCFFDAQKETWTSPEPYNGNLPEFAQLALFEDWIILLPTTQSNLSYLFGYNTKTKQWAQFGNELPGIPSRVHYYTDTNKLYVSGSTKSSNGSTYISVWDGHKFVSFLDKLSGSRDIQSMLVVPITGSSSPSTSLDLTNELPNGLGLLISGDLTVNSNPQSYSSVLYYQGQYYPYTSTSPSPSYSKLISTLPYSALEELSLPLPLIILISLAISLTIVAFIVCTGLGILWYRNHKTYRTHQNNMLPSVNSNEFLLHPSIFDSHSQRSPDSVQKKNANMHNAQNVEMSQNEIPHLLDNQHEFSPIESETVVNSDVPNMEVRRLDDLPSHDSSYDSLPNRPQSIAALTASTTFRSVHTSLTPSSKLAASSGEAPKSGSITTSSEGFTAESPSRKAMNRLSEAFPNLLASTKPQRASINTSSPTRLPIKNIPVKRVSQAVTLPDFSLTKSFDDSKRSSYRNQVEE
ncbi:hypothetical protein CONCODRAFT_76600 [Conidiobolus coronatus NRRL 28638]|uniref:Uncharacterized protein n=1 Tax=Conidiobolus coronatus (strain ATCC 28846 / CBS 209.66 / NRRL 28638) TaxID=796925 RepID=A0A137PIN8_CONC2|nr:hypothetical protein CONCODRAFT_76600 [Conidiobolus coronatus NRRL 28638]|eukprot:KXN74864.1 hypothetical protein CONCODRAFT_76600 [Conidiobolus coronatus NRRL 28638]